MRMAIRRNDRQPWPSISMGTGFADLAAGIPNRSVAGAEYAGAIGIVYGSSGGLSSFHSQFLTQDSPGIEGRARGWAFFGLSMTSGDFDG
jgi:hypothetical protein